MNRKIAIIDSDLAFGHIAEKFILQEWPNANISLVNPLEEGWPESDIYQDQDLLLFTINQFSDSDGLEWFKAHYGQAGYPPSAVLSNNATPNSLEAEAVNLGALGFYSKSIITQQNLSRFILDIFPQEDESFMSLELNQLESGSGFALNSDPKNSHKKCSNCSESDDSGCECIGYDFNNDAKIESPFANQESEEHDDQFPDLEFIDPSESTPEETDNAEVLELKEPKEDDSTEQKAPSTPKTKILLDGYILEKKIAEGGMSSIYLCTREEDGQRAVLKTISPKLVTGDKLKIIERTHLEYEVISRIKHPNVVRLYDHGTVKDIVYTTMEYFSTGDLKYQMSQGINQRQALSYLLQIADGLNAIHGCGIIHRDLKPANIMFRDDGTLAILDFGIAKDITRKLNLTPKGMRLGTPSYMSPEQGHKSYKPSAASDLYSLGVILYEMLSKQRPYTGTAKEVIKAHINAPIPQLPGDFFELQILLDRLMAKYPQDRFESAYDLQLFIKDNYRFDATLTLDFV